MIVVSECMVSLVQKLSRGAIRGAITVLDSFGNSSTGVQYAAVVSGGKITGVQHATDVVQSEVQQAERRSSAADERRW
jgi:hypothetical protein